MMLKHLLKYSTRSGVYYYFIRIVPGHQSYELLDI